MHQTSSAKIKEAAKQRGIGQRALAKIVGIAQSNLCVRLQRDYPWTDAEIQRIAAGLHIQADELGLHQKMLPKLEQRPLNAKMAVGDILIDETQKEIAQAIAVLHEPSGRSVGIFFNRLQMEMYLLADGDTRLTDAEHEAFLEDYLNEQPRLPWARLAGDAMEEIQGMLTMKYYLDQGVANGDFVMTPSPEGPLYSLPQQRQRDFRGSVTREEWNHILALADSGHTAKAIYGSYEPARRYTSLNSFSSALSGAKAARRYKQSRGIEY